MPRWSKEALPMLSDTYPPLRNYYIYLTGSCNLCCRHCWISPTFTESGEAGEYLDINLLEQAIAEAIPLGLKAARITGGEPLLHPQFRQIISLLAEKGLAVNLETNGTLIDESCAEHLAKTETLKFIAISLDGAKAETHDRHRGVAGSFDKACRGIKLLVEAGKMPQVIMSLHNKNIEEIEEVVKLVETIGCHTVKFNIIQPSGRADSMSRGGDLPTLDTLLEIGKWVETELQKKTLIRLYFDWPKAFRNLRQLHQEMTCHCHILNSLGLLANGNLALCGIGVQEPDLVFGSIGADSIKNIWETDPILLELRAKLPSELTGICGKCLLRYNCLGNCVAQNYHEAKSLTAPFWFCREAEEAGLFPVSRLE
jgi:SynChlorMet cassette radical SAM/SPASM protein ScmF